MSSSHTTSLRWRARVTKEAIDATLTRDEDEEDDNDRHQHYHRPRTLVRWIAHRLTNNPFCGLTFSRSSSSSTTVVVWGMCAMAAMTSILSVTSSHAWYRTAITTVQLVLVVCVVWQQLDLYPHQNCFSCFCRGGTGKADSEHDNNNTIGGGDSTTAAAASSSRTTRSALEAQQQQHSQWRTTILTLFAKHERWQLRRQQLDPSLDRMHEVERQLLQRLDRDRRQLQQEEEQNSASVNTTNNNNTESGDSEASDDDDNDANRNNTSPTMGSTKAIPTLETVDAVVRVVADLQNVHTRMRSGLERHVTKLIVAAAVAASSSRSTQRRTTVSSSSSSHWLVSGPDLERLVVALHQLAPAVTVHERRLRDAVVVDTSTTATNTTTPNDPEKNDDRTTTTKRPDDEGDDGAMEAVNLQPLLSKVSHATALPIFTYHPDQLKAYEY